MTDEQIRAVARDALARRPTLRLALRLRGIIILLVMALTAAALIYFAGWRPGVAIMVTGVVATLLVLLWGVVWVNWVLFPLTREMAGPDDRPLKE